MHHCGYLFLINKENSCEFECDKLLWSLFLLQSSKFWRCAFRATLLAVIQALLVWLRLPWAVPQCKWSIKLFLFCLVYVHMYELLWAIILFIWRTLMLTTCYPYTGQVSNYLYLLACGLEVNSQLKVWLSELVCHKNYYYYYYYYCCLLSMEPWAAAKKVSCQCGGATSSCPGSWP